ncbi:unnamed protein product, partial [Ectocarpus sp. 12 AP-2014]
MTQRVHRRCGASCFTVNIADASLVLHGNRLRLVELHTEDTTLEFIRPNLVLGRPSRLGPGRGSRQPHAGRPHNRDPRGREGSETAAEEAHPRDTANQPAVEKGFRR